MGRPYTLAMFEPSALRRFGRKVVAGIGLLALAMGLIMVFAEVETYEEP